ncbi:hypothetical protein [Bradyrhizobium sp. McL0615]|uniref:hypothetical protein n=1 Tax=Bradyrhizobium sp. McL0615 TaxID=3415673 RepID=UPI003CF8F537
MQASDAGAFSTAGQAATFKTQLAAAPGSLSISGNASFQIIEAVSVGGYTVSGQPVAGKLSFVVSAGAVSASGKPVSFTIGLAVARGAFTINGIAPSATTIMRADAGASSTTGNAELSRTGYDHDKQQYGGIGHYLLELERARQLAAITRKVPGVPIDRRTVPRFAPLRASPVATAAPAVDMQAVENERAAAAAAAKQAAQKRRREEEAILLLVC